jgi:hypothetical protein
MYGIDLFVDHIGFSLFSHPIHSPHIRLRFSRLPRTVPGLETEDELTYARPHIPCLLAFLAWYPARALRHVHACLRSHFPFDGEDP